MVIKKRTLSAQEQQALRSALQTATLEALMASRRWEPGDIAFQGGTSLHLVHGSARFSEDLDFMVRGGLSLAGLSAKVLEKLNLPANISPDLKLSVTAGKDEKNPHSFYVVLSGPDVLGSAKVKVELWQTGDAALKSLQVRVSTVASASGQAFVPTLTLEEVLADKVYALGARSRIKPRDVFDLWWLAQKLPAAALAVPAQALRTRLQIYPSTGGKLADTAHQWLRSAALRLGELAAPAAPKVVAQDLQRWLPSSWKMDATVAADMLRPAIAQLQAAVVTMQAIAQATVVEDASVDDGGAA